MKNYPDLQFKPVQGDVVQAANAYISTVRSFMDTLQSNKFDSKIADKLRNKTVQINNDLELYIGSSNNNKGKLPKLVIPDPKQPSNSGNISFGGYPLGSFRDFKKKCTANVDKSDCEKWQESIRLISAVNSLLSRYKVSIIDESLEKYEKSLDRYIGAWDEYLDVRKPQLPWEMLINQVYNADVRKVDYFNLPPRSDLILMHPSLVYSKVSSSNSDNINLAWEVIGYNRWESEYLSGVSIVNFGTDKKIIDNSNWGVMLHIANKYSVGWINHKEDGHYWFASIDLLTAVQDKRKKLVDKRTEFNSNFNKIKGSLK